MLKRAILSAAFFFLAGMNLSYALDWKSLHERADKINLSAALKEARARPESRDDLYILGLVYLNLHRDKEAGEAFGQVLRLEPETAEAKWGLSEVLRRQHQPKKSEQLLAEVFKSIPDFPPALITLAYIEYIRMDFNRAVRLANQVLKQSEKGVDISNRVRAYLLYGGTKGMIAHYGGPLSKLVNGTAVLPNLKAAEKLQPDSAGVKFGLGSFYFLAPGLAGGDPQRAEEYLKRAIALDPLFADAYVRLAQFYQMKDDSARYNEYLNQALKIDPGNELALDIKSGRCKFICPARDR
ncbi:MAG: TRAP transporter TatT component family protein [Candidatus Omnitrophota bacterium]|jgi:tetratricopeptide (TPR) repeat protein